MNNDWFFIAFLVPFFFAIVNIIDDNLLRGVYKTAYFGTIITGLFALIPIITLLFIPINIPKTPIMIIAILMGFLNTLYYFFYFKSLATDLPSVVVSLFSLAFVSVPILAFIFLKERLFPHQYLGFALVLSSSLLISLINIKNFKLSKTFYFMFLSSSFYAVVAILQKYVYSQIDFWGGYIFFSIGMGLGALFFIILFKEGKSFVVDLKKIFRKWIVIFTIAEAFNFLAEFSLNLAISRGPVSLVKVIEGTQPVFVLLLALFLFPFFPKYFREASQGNVVKKLSLMAIMIVGLYFINL